MIVRIGHRWVWGMLTALLLVLPRAARAHELPGASATLIVREGGFVELRLLVPWSDVLRAQWMPRATPEVFLGTVVNQAPAAFARALAQVEAQVVRDLQVVANGQRAFAFTRWQWPDAAAVQAALRTELMARLAAPGADHHGERLAASAAVRTGADLSAVQLQAARVLGPMLVTAYRPAEQWVGAGARSAPIAVGRR